MKTSATRAQQQVWDLIVVGGGPAGSQAALGAATEGKRVLLVEGGQIGGQIGQTPHLENLAGHTYGVTGPAIARAFEEQAGRFGVRWLHGYAQGIRRCEEGLLHVEVTEDSEAGTEVTARAVILALGQRFRRLGIPGEDHPTVYHGPSECIGFDAMDREVIVVGGSNSAGQAIVRLSQQGAKMVHVVARSKLATSEYLTQRIRRSNNVRVYEGAKLVEVHGRGEDLCWAVVQDDSGPRRIETCRIYVCVGMEPACSWLPEDLERDANGLLVTNRDFSTTIPGVFAVGDCRSGAVNRVPVAMGEGAAVMQPLWEYLRTAPILGCSVSFGRQS